MSNGKLKGHKFVWKQGDKKIIILTIYALKDYVLTGTEDFMLFKVG